MLEQKYKKQKSIFSKIIKQIIYLIEAFLAYTLFIIFYILPIDIASYIGGQILEFLGRYLPASKIAMRNLNLCFPNMETKIKKQIVRRMWNNLGRIIGELPHWYRISPEEFKKRVSIPKALKIKYNNKIVLLSAHFGNWELCNRLMMYEKIQSCFIYRPLNNPYVNALLNYTRRKCGTMLIPKTVNGIKTVIKEVKKENGRMLGMLFDQRYDDGVYASFFGIETPTAAAAVSIAMQYNLKIMMSRVLRINNSAKYKIEFYTTKKLSNKLLNREETIKENIEHLNNILMEWIIQNPEQWFWVHRKFPRSFYNV